MNNRYSIKGVLDASDDRAYKLVGGIPLVSRNLYYLIELGIKEVIIFVSKEIDILDLYKWKGKVKITYIRIKGVEKGIQQYLFELTEDVIFYINSSYLFDKRIIEKVISSHPNTIFLENNVKYDELEEKIPMGLFDKEGIMIWQENGYKGLLSKSNLLSIQDIEHFSEEMRGKVKPYVVYVKDDEDARKATWILIKNMQKKVMDLPAEYIDPVFENYLTYLLCRTRVTPNMVTIFSLFIATAIAFLFYNGYFILGAFCTYIVEILDGVDGKLARTKLQFSRFGEYECLVDYFYENLWYIAIGMGLKRIYHYNSAVFFSGIMIISDTLDNILYTLSNKWIGKNLDLLSPFNMAFRKIAGRRNIYCFIFMVGFLFGYYLETFMLASVWAVITVIIHTIVLIRHKKKLT